MPFESNPLDARAGLTRVTHTDPELHRIGETFLSPETPKPIKSTTVSYTGKSEAVARADHIHTLILDNALTIYDTTNVLVSSWTNPLPNIGTNNFSSYSPLKTLTNNSSRDMILFLRAYSNFSCFYKTNVGMSTGIEVETNGTPSILSVYNKFGADTTHATRFSYEFVFAIPPATSFTFRCRSVVNTDGATSFALASEGYLVGTAT